MPPVPGWRYSKGHLQGFQIVGLTARTSIYFGRTKFDATPVWTPVPINPAQLALEMLVVAARWSFGKWLPWGAPGWGLGFGVCSGMLRAQGAPKEPWPLVLRRCKDREGRKGWDDLLSAGWSPEITWKLQGGFLHPLPVRGSKFHTLTSERHRCIGWCNPCLCLPVCGLFSKSLTPNWALMRSSLICLTVKTPVGWDQNTTLRHHFFYPI